MMATLESGFEDDLREALLEEIEQTLAEEIGPLLIATARENFQQYAGAHGYDIDHIWDDVDGPTVARDGDSVEMRVEWPELTALFEFGVSPHTIEGDPVLHFYYEKIDQEITVSSVEWGSETGGIPESRAIRDALQTVRRVTQA
ncbi:hypothetical protein Hbl1158_02910 [Halobaculum sp. CBA1158]|uniref:hypothetical protein n=1 Tax=Halobaculum sp. CBA1158 TaxID=2904243 RepID=UPI001F1EC443|nr:hypothetical protein [Halobaculum sp. CBA1158]UIP00337.1 hypothetical protein Hbl1158_02910 [Halobaculum sp. CBA1158]